MTEERSTGHQPHATSGRRQRQPTRRLLYQWTSIAVAARTADEAVTVGSVLAVLSLHGHGGAAVTAATVTASSALAGPLVGVMLDRSGSVTALIRREVVGMCLLGLGLSAFVVAVAVAAPVMALLPLAVVLGACAPVVGSGWSVVAVAMTSPPHGVRWTRTASPSALDAAAYNSAGIVGPAAAGLLLSRGPVGLLVIPLVVVAAAVAAARLRHSVARTTGPPGAAMAAKTVWAPPASERAEPRRRGAQAEGGGRRGAVGKVFSGFHLLGETSPLRCTTTTTTISYAGMGLTMVGLPVHAAQFEAGAAGGGMLLSAVAVGALVGTALMATPPLHQEADSAVLLGTAGVGAGLASLSMAQSLTSSMVGAVLVGVADGLLFTGMLRVRERDLPPAGRNSAYTSAATLKIAAFALGAGSVGLLPADGRILLLTAAAVQGAALLAGTLASRPRLSTDLVTLLRALKPLAEVTGRSRGAPGRSRRRR